MDNFSELIQNITVWVLPVLFSITVHEAAHGYAARHFGDNTAYMLGRITLNPIKHIDPIGTILMPLMLYLASAGAFVFGYAKPVPVRFGNLRNPKRDMVWVALAGPGANLVQAMMWGVLFIALRGNGEEADFFMRMADAGVKINVLMFVFNLFPLPPLDGGRILVGLLPMRQAVAVSRVEPWGFFIVLALVFSGLANTFWMQPLKAVTYWLLGLLLSPISMIFG